MVHGNIQVHLVAGRAELRDLVRQPVKGFQEGVAMRLGIEPYIVVVQETKQRVVALRQLRELRVFKGDSSLPHGAVDVHDGVAGHAAQPVLPGARVLDVADRELLHLVGDREGVIVAAPAPERRLDADRVLHVLDRLPVPLVVERRKVVHRALPLIVDIPVAPLAGLGAHEELGENRLAVGSLGGARKHEALGAAAFVVHAERRRPGIADDVSRVGIRAVVKRHGSVESRRCQHHAGAPTPGSSGVRGSGFGVRERLFDFEPRTRSLDFGAQVDEQQE